jgi:hypothetical protein
VRGARLPDTPTSRVARTGGHDEDRHAYRTLYTRGEFRRLKLGALRRWCVWRGAVRGFSMWRASTRRCCAIERPSARRRLARGAGRPQEATGVLLVAVDLWADAQPPDSGRDVRFLHREPLGPALWAYWRPPPRHGARARLRRPAARARPRCGPAVRRRARGRAAAPRCGRPWERPARRVMESRRHRLLKFPRSAHRISSGSGTRLIGHRPGLCLCRPPPHRPRRSLAAPPTLAGGERSWTDRHSRRNRVLRPLRRRIGSRHSNPPAC